MFHYELMINPGTPIKCVFSAMVGYHNACGGLPLWHMVVVQYSGALSWYVRWLSIVVFSKEKNQKNESWPMTFTTYIMITYQISHGSPWLY